MDCLLLKGEGVNAPKTVVLESVQGALETEVRHQGRRPQQMSAVAEGKREDSAIPPDEKDGCVGAVCEFLKFLSNSGLDELQPWRRRLVSRRYVESAREVEASSYLVAIESAWVL